MVEIDAELHQTSPSYNAASSFSPAVFAFKFSFHCATAELSWEQISVLFTVQESAFQQPSSLFFSALAKIYTVVFVFVECQFASQISYSSCVCRETIVIFPHALKSIYSMYIRKHRVNTEWANKEALSGNKKIKTVKSDCFSSNTFRGLQCFFFFF